MEGYVRQVGGRGGNGGEMQKYRNENIYCKEKRKKCTEILSKIMLDRWVGGVGMVGKDSSGDNKPDKLPLTNVSSSPDDDDDDAHDHDDHDDDPPNKCFLFS